MACIIRAGTGAKTSGRRYRNEFNGRLNSRVEPLREVLKLYETIPTGSFGAAIIRQDIEFAEKAMGSGDVVAMVQAYEKLKAIEHK